MVRRWVVNALPIISQMGCIASAKQDLESLVQVGLRLSPAVLAQAIALAGE